MVEEGYIKGTNIYTSTHLQAHTLSVFYVLRAAIVVRTCFFPKIIMTDGGNMVEYAPLKSMHCGRQ